MLSYSHMTIWANQSWLALGLDLDGLWSWKFGMVLVMNPLFDSKWKFVFLIRNIEMVKTSASVAPHSPDSLSGAVAGQV